MVQVRSTGPARGAGAADTPMGLRARQCLYCKRRVVYMRTYIAGSMLTFDATPLPRELDCDSEGWLPGWFDVDGVKAVVLAPYAMHGIEARRGVRHVMRLHICRSRNRQQVA